MRRGIVKRVPSGRGGWKPQNFDGLEMNRRDWSVFKYNPSQRIQTPVGHHRRVQTPCFEKITFFSTQKEEKKGETFSFESTAKAKKPCTEYFSYFGIHKVSLN